MFYIRNKDLPEGRNILKRMFQDPGGCAYVTWVFDTREEADKKREELGGNTEAVTFDQLTKLERGR